MNVKLLLSISLSLLIIAALSSCQSDGDDFNSKVGKIVTVHGEIVKGPSGYMLFRGGDLVHKNINTMTYNY
jgi:hypothetical protein